MQDELTARQELYARIVAAVEGLPTMDIRTSSAHALYDKALKSSTQEVTVTAQQLRVLLPTIETDAVAAVLDTIKKVSDD